MTTETNETRLPQEVTLTVEIVTAYVAKNSIPASEVPALIAATHAELVKLSAPPVAQPEPLTPPVPIKKTITPDYIISLEDGKKYKSLRRHLTSRGLTAEAYREKWGLAYDYPMVCSAYAAERSALAKSIGLGRTRNRKLKAAA